MASKPPNLRLHIERRDGSLHTVAQAAFGADGSLYLVPYALNGEYWYGEQAFTPDQGSFEIRFKKQVSAASRPKLSLHWSGGTHIYSAGSSKAGPTPAAPLGELRGEHVASIQFDHVDRLPIATRPTKTTGAKIDIAFGMPDDVKAGRRKASDTEQRFLFLRGL